MSTKEYFQAYHAAHREQRNARCRERYQRNREAALQGMKEHAASRKPEKAAYDRAYRERTREQRREYERARGKKNRAKLSVYHKEWRERNRESVSAQQKLYRQQNRERLAREKYVHVLLRRARQRAATIVLFTREQLDARLSMFGHRCWMCGGEAGQVDHVIPLARKGPHVLANLRPACGSCNNRKGSKSVTPKLNEARHGNRSGGKKVRA